MMGLRKVENRERGTGHKDNFYCHKARKNCPYDRKPLKANKKEATRASLSPLCLKGNALRLKTKRQIRGLIRPNCQQHLTKRTKISKKPQAQTIKRARAAQASHKMPNFVPHFQRLSCLCRFGATSVAKSRSLVRQVFSSLHPYFSPLPCLCKAHVHPSAAPSGFFWRLWSYAWCCISCRASAWAALK